MMTVLIIIFILSTTSLIGMLWFRSWEIKNKNREFEPQRKLPPEIYFRQVEKIMLYLTKHIVQWVVLVVVKYWFTLTTKAQKWILKKLPKIHDFFTKKPDQDVLKKTFVGRAILESKIKIKRVREKVKKESENAQ